MDFDRGRVDIAIPNCKYIRDKNIALVDFGKVDNFCVNSLKGMSTCHCSDSIGYFDIRLPNLDVKRTMIMFRSPGCDIEAVNASKDSGKDIQLDTPTK